MDLKTERGKKATELEKDRWTARECLGGRKRQKKMFTSAHPCRVHVYVSKPSVMYSRQK